MRLRMDKLAPLITIGICVMLVSLFLLLFLTRVDQTITVYGRFEAANPTYLRAPRDGYVDMVFVEDGALVKTGDTIMLISNPDDELEYEKLALELDSKRHELDQLGSQLDLLNWGALETSVSREVLPQASTRLDQAQRKMQVASALFEKGYISTDEYDQIRVDYELYATNYAVSKREIAYRKRLVLQQAHQATRQIHIIQAEMCRLRKAIDSSLLVAPCVGYVDLKYNSDIRSGNLQQGNIVAVISDPNRLNFVARLPERYVPEVTPGQKARIVMPSYASIRHRHAQAEVIAVRPAYGTNGFELTATLKESSAVAVLRPGMTGRARILQQADRRLLQQILSWNRDKGGI